MFVYEWSSSVLSFDMSIFISYIVLNGKSKLNVWWFEATKLFISAPCLLVEVESSNFLYPLFTVYHRVENDSLNVFFFSLKFSYFHSVMCVTS